MPAQTGSISKIGSGFASMGNAKGVGMSLFVVVVVVAVLVGLEYSGYGVSSLTTKIRDKVEA